MRIRDGPRCASVSLSATVHQNRASESGTVLISHADQTGTGRLQMRIVGWFLPAIQTSLSLVRALARIPDIRADGSSTGPRPRPVSGHARGLVVHWSAPPPGFRTFVRTSRTRPPDTPIPAAALGEGTNLGRGARGPKRILRDARSAGAAGGRRCLSDRRARVRRPAAPERRAPIPRMSGGPREPRTRTVPDSHA